MNWILPALADSEGVLIEKPWLRVHVRRGANRAASGMVFLGMGGGSVLRTDSLRLPVPPEVLLLTVVTEGAEGAPENLFRLPSGQLSVRFVEKRAWCPLIPQHPYCRCGDCSSLEGPGQAALRRMICLRYTHSGENAHDSEFGITVPPPNPFLKKM